MFLSAFIGSAMGTTLIQFIEPELLKKTAPDPDYRGRHLLYFCAKSQRTEKKAAGIPVSLLVDLWGMHWFL
ncbi:Uncharacterised protein [Citrobacter freundii]|nr:Uncharacterised protein [Citrobacter freundii]